MPSLTVADPEKLLIKRAAQGKGKKVVTATVAQLYVAYPDASRWTYANATGAAVLVKDGPRNAHLLQVVDILGDRGVIWEQELYEGFTYTKDKPFFHTFSADGYAAAFSFADDSEATIFHDKVVNVCTTTKNRAPATGSPPSLSTLSRAPGSQKSKGKGKGKKIDKAMIGQPLNFQHLSHIGWSREKGFNAENMPEDWRKLLVDSGISMEQMKDEKTAEFVYNFVESRGGPSARSSTILSQVHTIQPVAVSTPTGSKARRPPPPPPARRPETSPRFPLGDSTSKVAPATNAQHLPYTSLPRSQSSTLEPTPDSVAPKQETGQRPQQPRRLPPPLPLQRLKPSMSCSESLAMLSGPVLPKSIPPAVESTPRPLLPAERSAVITRAAPEAQPHSPWKPQGPGCVPGYLPCTLAENSVVDAASVVSPPPPPPPPPPLPPPNLLSKSPGIPPRLLPPPLATAASTSLPAAADGRADLLASIRAAGIGSLKAAGSSQVPAASGQHEKTKPKCGTEDSSDLASALAAALAARSKQIADSSDEDEDNDEWN